METNSESEMGEAVPHIASESWVSLLAKLRNHKSLAVIVICALLVAAIALFLVARSKKPSQMVPPPLEVEVIHVEQKDVSIYSDWIGTTDGFVNADIRAEVSGYLMTKNYTEGSFVKQGQMLFQIDPRPLEASLSQANGDLAKSEGQLGQARSQLDQAQAQLAQAKSQLLQAQSTLAVAEANQVKAAEANVGNAKAAIVAAEAQVQASQAAVKTAQLNLGFTRIVSPIDGVVGIAQAQVGDLVNPTSGIITTVSTVDPIKVYFTVSEQEYLNYTKRYPTQAERDAAAKQLELELFLADGA